MDVDVGGKVGSKNLRDAITKALPRIHCFVQRCEDIGLAVGRWLSKDELEILRAPSDTNDCLPASIFSGEGSNFLTTKAEGTTLNTAGKTPVRYLLIDAKPMGGLGWEEAKETLFVNAAKRCNRRNQDRVALDWYLVDIDLPKSNVSDDQKVPPAPRCKTPINRSRAALADLIWPTLIKYESFTNIDDETEDVRSSEDPL